MPVERPTFSESWYRVASLRPRLRSSVQIHRQHFRGQTWHVVQDPSNNQFFRLADSAYRFVALLEGRRTVAQAWQLCNEQLGDNAPTQGEAIQLMGQLYSSNLLAAEMPPDAQGLLQRYRKRVSREVRSYLMNLLFIRIPVLDPDRFLDAWVGILGKVFTWYGAVLWAVLVCAGGYVALSHYDDLRNQTLATYDMIGLNTNLLLLYGSFIFIKVFHEFGHAVACKKFGSQSGSGGEVHVMGVMFLVFTPMPYVDASSSWAFRQKWHRALVGAAGMIVELAVASVAAIVWATVPAQHPLHALAYNVMFIGSVSTLIFNGNPLLRYDGYYILSDLLEIPNLAQRSKDYLYYLVKKYVWGFKQARNPAHTRGERAWFVFYGIASAIYRTIVVAAIVLFVAGKVFFLGIALALAMIIPYVCVPIVKFVHYLASNNELMRVRGRAVASTVVFVLLVLGGIGLFPAPDHVYVEGVVEPADMREVYARSDGFLQDFLPSGSLVQADAPEPAVLLDQTNPELEMNLRVLLAQGDELLARKRLYQAQGELGLAMVMDSALRNLHRVHIPQAREDLRNLRLRPPMSGEWNSPEIDGLRGQFVRRQQLVGMIISSRVIILTKAPQSIAPMLIFEADPNKVQIRVEGRAEDLVDARIIKIYPAGSEYLPSAALGYSVGGTVPTDPKDPHGTTASEKLLDIQLAPTPSDDQQRAVRLLPGQRVMVRFELPPKPLALQWWRSLLQLVQRKFQI